MNFRELLYDGEFLLVKGAVAAGTTDTQTFTEVDMLGYDSCVLIAAIGTVTATGTATMTAKNSDTSVTYGAGTIDSLSTDGTAANVISVAVDDTMSNKLLVLDFHRVPRRYLRGQIARATANVVITAAIAIRYNGRQKPVTQSSNVAASSAGSNPVPSAA